MKKFGILLLFVSGLALTVYLSLWVCLIGGILEVAQGINEPSGLGDIVWGIIRVLLTGLVALASMSCLNFLIKWAVEV